ncbi:hypothetical protein FVF58_03110 [Paraburkholderia panacisoli]|uniref:Uncharacterized protein n=1 Tax=Paraburkholderia panacisoli TaxID=2603818 RepID=A0A5B0HII8_9BURK|nr:hypothetical protein [Paraburkholderia panacisoli]KAA1014928.1 hypothetical protein FVF58_03110 [Paraburkholderia panacisoli]
MRRVRAKNLDDEVVASIVDLLDGWSGKLSWELLIDAVERRKKLRYTRQALHRHERIRLAFGVRKAALADQSDEPDTHDDSPELKLALDEIARLRGENQRLESENNRLLEQFARWAYNAHTRNLTREFLNQPLPGVDRESSDRPRKGRPIQVAKKG